jgi:gluconate 2-dehydrogenase gamma chain
MTTLSRRELLKRAGMLGAAAAAAPAAAPASPNASTQAPVAAAPAVREPLETLTAAEADILDAVVARLIPTDANGPGATEARAAHYIDRALGGALASSREAYSGGLAALDAYARSSRGAPFAQLSAADQDLVLTDVESGAATGFGASSAIFFELMRNHTIQGTFCDPFYGGNAKFAGWDLIGYPGVRTLVTPEEQRMGITLKPNHRSAYDYGMFTKATASARSEEHLTHGD